MLSLPFPYALCWPHSVHTLVKVSAPWTFALNLLNQKRCGWAGWRTHSTGNFNFFFLLFSSLPFSLNLTGLETAQGAAARTGVGERPSDWCCRQGEHATEWWPTVVFFCLSSFLLFGVCACACACMCVCVCCTSTSFWSLPAKSTFQHHSVVEGKIYVYKYIYIYI